MRVHQTEAIILRVSDFGEADQIVSFYSRDLGKFSALAKHARKSRRRFAGNLQLFNLLTIKVRLRDQHSFGFLELVRPVVSLAGIYNDWRRIVLACCLVDMVHAVTRDGAKNRALYLNLRNALLRLHHGDAWLTVLAEFEYQLLENSGFGPAFDHCVVCRRTLEADETGFWIHEAGGMHCKRCVPMHREAQKLLPEDRILAHSAPLLYDFLCHQLGHPLRSWDLLVQMGLLPATVGSERDRARA